MNNDNNINTNNENKNKTTNFNKILMNSVKNYKITAKTKNSAHQKYKTEDDYQNSFKDIIKFADKYPDKTKKEINIVIFHESNNDGFLAAYIAWRFLIKDNAGSNIPFIGMRPGHQKDVVDYRIKTTLPIMKDKNVLIVDLSYNKETINAIKETAKSLIIIHDHPETTQANDYTFVAETHAACAYTWKFFYPKIDVPMMIQYIDNSDRKLFLPYISHTNYLALSFGFRFVHDVSPKNTFFDKLKVFDTIFDKPNFLVFVGKYYDEVRENIKEQIAQNAQIANFQGYRVGVLNFNAPSLTKVVGRQIITNMKNKGEHIDFAVLWGYEYTANPGAYNVTLIDDHKQTKINLVDIVKRLGNISGHRKGAGGKPHEAHFYWTKDIWDLFK